MIRRQYEKPGRIRPGFCVPDPEGILFELNVVDEDLGQLIHIIVHTGDREDNVITGGVGNRDLAHRHVEGDAGNGGGQGVVSMSFWEATTAASMEPLIVMPPEEVQTALILVPIPASASVGLVEDFREARG